MAKDLNRMQFFNTDYLMSNFFRVNHGIYLKDREYEIYCFTLFILSLYKDNIINYDDTNEKKPIKKQLRINILKNKTGLGKIYRDIFHAFEDIYINMSSSDLYHLVSNTCNLDRALLTEKFPGLCEDIIQEILRLEERSVNSNEIPLEITKIIYGLFELPENAKIYNPFAGYGSLAIHNGKNVTYLGNERDEIAWAIGVLRIMAHNKTCNSKLTRQIPYFKWPKEKFDLIVSKPPQGRYVLPLNNNLPEDFEEFLFLKGLNSLKKNGKLIAILSGSMQSTTIVTDKKRFRSLIEKDLIDTVISLPLRIVRYSEHRSMIVVINKNKTYPGKVRLIRTEDYIFDDEQNEKKLNAIALNKVINNSKNDNNVVRFVSNEHIKDQNFCLNVYKYFRNEIIVNKNEKLFSLRNILTKIDGKKGNFPAHGRIVRVKNLKNDKLDYRITAKDLEDDLLKTQSMSKIDTSCLLIANNSLRLSPSYFEYEGTPIYKENNIVCFKVDTSIVDINFLINELQADYVQEQFNLNKNGIIRPSISILNMLDISIKLPSINEQRAKVKGIYEVANEIRLLQAKLESITVKESEVKYEKDASLKHRLGGPLLNLGSSVRNIERVLDQKFDSWGEIKLSDRHEITLKDTFKSIYQTLDMVHQILANNEDEIDFSNKKLDELDIVAFLNNYVKRAKSAGKPNVSIKLDIHPDIKFELKNEAIILGNPELLNIALDTIVENAYKHAFINDAEKYKLDFRLGLQDASRSKQYIFSEHGTFIKIEVANNGKAFPDNFSLDKLIMKNRFAGETGNTGQGGFDLNEIIKFHNKGESTLDLIKGESPSEFSTTYSFLIPLNR
jgi:type I restriction enzyme M protein